MIKRVLVDVESEQLKFRVNEDEVTFNLCKSMKHPRDIHVISTNYCIYESLASVIHLMCMSDPLEVELVNSDETDIKGYDDVVEELLCLEGKEI